MVTAIGHRAGAQVESSRAEAAHPFTRAGPGPGGLPILGFRHPGACRTGPSVAPVLLCGRKTVPENRPFWKRLRRTTDLGESGAIVIFEPIRRRVTTLSIRLVKALRLSFDRRTGVGFFLRVESFFNLASHIDELDKEPGGGPPVTAFYGGRSLHTCSHGETLFTLLDLKFRRNGLFLLDEPEAALSPQRQLAFLVLIHDVLRKFKDAQFIISTHSPILLAYPDAQIVSFDDASLRDIDYKQTGSFQVAHRFLDHRDEFLKKLFADTPALFDQK